MRQLAVDVLHARFAYFFPPGCDAGLADVHRLLRPGGRLVVADNDQRHGDFADLLAAPTTAAAQGRADITDQRWADRRAQRQDVMSRWQFDSRADLVAVLRMEFPAGVADAWLDQHPAATGLSYGYVLFAYRITELSSCFRRASHRRPDVDPDGEGTAARERSVA